MRILIVEDDRKLAHQLKKGMEEQGHVVAVQLEGAAGLEAAIRSQFDVLVLDVMLPGLDGFSIVRRLRAARNATPILLLTARDTSDDIVTGLDAGADDYLTKSFSFKVLLARLRALSRRKNVEPSTKMQIGDLVIDPATREVRRCGFAIALTRTEFILLEMLMRNVGRVITRTRMIEVVWGHEREIENQRAAGNVYEPCWATPTVPAANAKAQVDRKYMTYLRQTIRNQSEDFVIISH